MTRVLILLLAATLTLSACGGWSDSRLNPGNWFGRSQAVPVQADPANAVNPLIPQGSNLLAREERPDLHVPILKISDLVIEPTSSGAILRASGIAAVQGAYSARLVLNDGGVSEDGVLSYTFEVLYPENPRPIGPENARTINVARSLTHQDLAPVRTIRVVGEQNARESRRR